MEKSSYHKGQEVLLDIIDMGTNGEGIGQIEGYTLFVKDAMEGDRIRAKIIKTKKNYGYARLMEIIKPSSWRIEPVCSKARQCGGCQLQHCSYEKQLIWKEKKVADCLTRIGGFFVYPSYNDGQKNEESMENIEKGEKEQKKDRLHMNGIRMEPILRMDEPFHYRNKAQYPVGYDKEGKLVTGFYAGRTHVIIPNTDCAIQHPCNQTILETILEWMEQNRISAYDEKNHTGLVRHILLRTGISTGELMICLVINGTRLPKQEKMVEQLLKLSFDMEEGNKTTYQIKSICLNINMEKTNRILGDKIEVLYGKGFIIDQVRDIYYQISPLSFYQVNSGQMVKLYDTVLEYADLTGKETVWDLYCGIGTISLFLARKAGQVYGVEIVPQAIEDARENAKMNGIENVEFMTGAAEEIVPERMKQSADSLRADVVVLDPPRKGCDRRLLETVLQMQPERIVYVSCDPATLARDLKFLCGDRYDLKRVRACDMFGQSSHIECVTMLQRR